jgi:lysocardiolipin and lysophospholipid acyltransferase
MFLYSYLARFGDLKNHRITLKTSLKHIPLYGYILQLIPYIFLNRKWDSDKQTISNMLNHYCNVNRIPVQLLLFPEGTDLSERNKQRDRDYAIVNNLPVNTYTMHPRTTGFIHCMKTLRNEWGNGKVNICDITIGYLGVIPQSEKDLLKGTLPKEVHYHVKHYPSSSLPSSDEGLSDWLKERWVEKEERLANFYQSHSFPGPIFQDGWRTKALMIAAFIKWLVLCGTAIYTLFNAPVLTIGSIAIPVIICFIVDKRMDGWDTIMTRY